MISSSIGIAAMVLLEPLQYTTTTSVGSLQAISGTVTFQPSPGRWWPPRSRPRVRWTYDVVTAQTTPAGLGAPLASPLLVRFYVPQSTRCWWPSRARVRRVNSIRRRAPINHSYADQIRSPSVRRIEALFGFPFCLGCCDVLPARRNNEYARTTACGQACRASRSNPLFGAASAHTFLHESPLLAPLSQTKEKDPANQDR
jgi:hypothetical protein